MQLDHLKRGHLGRRYIKSFASGIAGSFSSAANHYAWLAYQCKSPYVIVDLLSPKIHPAEFDIERSRNLANMCRRQLQRNIKSLSPPGSVTSAVLTAEFRIDDIHQDGQTTTVGESIFTVTLVDDRGKEWRVELKIEEILAQG